MVVGFRVRFAGAEALEYWVALVPMSTHCVTSVSSGFRIRTGGLRAGVTGRLIFASEV